METRLIRLDKDEAYVASKHGVVALTRSAAMEVGRRILVSTLPARDEYYLPLAMFWKLIHIVRC